MDLLSATGLAGAAGLNAYIPLLIFGVLARFTDVVTLPAGWQWLTDPALLVIVAILLVIEIVADKIPVVDSINDVIQTVIRPASGGIVFASGLDAYGAPTQVRDGSVFSEPRTWIALAAGILIAFIMHALKATARPAVNASTIGTGAAFVSTAEDTTAAGLSLMAIFIPILAGLAVIAIIGLFGSLAYRTVTWRANRKKATRREVNDAAVSDRPEGT